MPKCDFSEVALHIFRTPFYKITYVGLLLRLLNLLISKYRIFHILYKRHSLLNFPSLGGGGGRLLGIPTLVGSVHWNLVSKFKNDKKQHAI